jgi:hypothetical protein
MTTTRIVLLSAEAQSIDAVLTAELPPALTVVAICWQSPRPETAAVIAALADATLIDLSAAGPPVGESMLRALGIAAVTEFLRRTAPGRLIASFSPAHRSRRFAARLRAAGGWTPAAGDAIVALDLAATRAAWFSARSARGTSATFGLAPALKRIAQEAPAA